MAGVSAPEVISEGRGTTAVVVLSDASHHSQCLFSSDQAISSWTWDLVPPSVTTDQVSVMSNGSDSFRLVSADDAGSPKPPGKVEQVWEIDGRVGPEVTSIVLHRAGKAYVVATVHKGCFMAWWPSVQIPDAPTSMTVTSANGTVRVLPIEY